MITRITQIKSSNTNAVADLRVTLDTRIPKVKKMEIYRSEVRTTNPIRAQSEEPRTTSPENHTTMRQARSPTNNGSDTLIMPPMNFPIRMT